MMNRIQQPRRRSLWFLLGLIVLAGLGLRLWYASWDLTDQRYWDEKYSLDNVRPIMLERSLAPVSGYYPSPVFTLPAALLFEGSAALGRATDSPALMPMKDTQFTSTAILLSRLLMTAYGCGTIILAFLIGRRMAAADGAGLLAAGMVAFSPWMIHSSGYYKPDSLLVMMVALAFYASLRAVESTQVRWYALAGVAIALAMSAKLTGGLAAVPLMVATVMYGGHRDRRRAGRLMLAGAISAGAFVVVNPYWQHYLYFLSGLKRDYAMRAGWVGDTKLDMPIRVAQLIVDDYGHDLLFGTLSLLGLVLFGWVWGQRGMPRSVRVPRAMLLAFVVTYAAAYTVQTSYFKGNNFLPLLPFTAVAAACLFYRIGRWAVAHGPARGRLAIAGGLVVVAVVGMVPAGFLYVYQSLVPTTHDVALEDLARKLSRDHGRIAFLEQWPQTKTAWEGRQPFARGETVLVTSKDLVTLPLARLRAADGVVFRVSGPADSQAGRDALAALGPNKKTLYEPKAFRLRGPPMVSVYHRWTSAAPTAVIEAEPVVGPPGWFDVTLPPDLVAGEVVSFSVWVPFAVRGAGAAVPHFEQNGHRLTLNLRRRVSDGDAFATERVMLDDVTKPVRIAVDPQVYNATKAHHATRTEAFSNVLETTGETITVHVHRWRSGR